MKQNILAMFRNPLFYGLGLLALLAAGCRSTSLGDQADEGLTLRAQFPATKAAEEAFSVGDPIGLYVARYGRALDPSGNLVDNARMEVGSDGTIRGVPAPVYYPDAREAATLYAYYPYRASATADAVPAGIEADQTTYARHTASDFCVGYALATTPTAVALPTKFVHRLARIHVLFTLPAGATGVSALELKGVRTDASYSLATDALTLGAPTADAKAYRVSGTEFLAVVPPQTLSADVWLTADVAFADGSNERFSFGGRAEAFAASTTHIYRLTLRADKRTLAEVEPVQTVDWTTGNKAGAPTDRIDNAFTVHWLLPHARYAEADGVELRIENPSTGATAVLPASSFAWSAGHSAVAATATFSFAPAAVEPFSYPYRLTGVRFMKGATLISECVGVLGECVYRTGPYTIGIQAQNLLKVAVGTVTDWNELFVGGSTGGVDNSFGLELLEQPCYADAHKVRIRIDGTDYLFTNIVYTPESNRLTASTVVAFPDAAGRTPNRYPFTVERVTLLDASDGTVGVYAAAVPIDRAGLYTLRLAHGQVLAPRWTVSGYAAASGSGAPTYEGAVKNNPVKIVYTNGNATAASACNSIATAVLTTEGGEVTLSGYSMTGDRYNAQSAAPHADIVSGVGAGRPLRYPFTVSRVKFLKADGTVLVDAALSAPVRVEWWGEVVFSAMVEMPNVVTVPQTPTANDYVVINGLRWAKGNLIAVDNANCRVGAPTDGGVYFQFGSLIGWKGGNQVYGGTGEGIPQAPLTTNGTHWNGTDFSWVSDAMVWPTEFRDGATKIGSVWPRNRTDLNFYFGYNAPPYETEDKDIRDYSGFASGVLAAQGVGDPCSYYLGSEWRLPTMNEIKALCNNQGSLGQNIPWSNCNASWGSSGGVAGGNFSGTTLFIPASGYRVGSGASFYSVTAGGHYWSSSVTDAAGGCNLRFGSSSVYPQQNTTRSYGFPVRCVGDIPRTVNPPRADQIVPIGGKLWATGNLVAVDGANCRVGAPTDNGLYFQFGSLVGWSGGAAGNGTGAPSTAPALEIKARPAGYRGGLAWTTAGYYKGGAAGETLPATDDPTTGVGDPCRYYLGAPWRTPTQSDYVALYNSGTSASTGDFKVLNTVKGHYLGPGASSSTDLSTLIFLPAVGARERTQGVVYSVSIESWYQSSVVSSPTVGYCLYFKNNNVQPSAQGTARDFGLSVRCMADN